MNIRCYSFALDGSRPTRRDLASRWLASVLVVALVASGPTSAFAQISFSTPTSSSTAEEEQAADTVAERKSVPGTVIDLCQVEAPSQAGGGYAKRRLVVFDVAGETATHGPEVEVGPKGETLTSGHTAFQAARAHDHVRETFFATFPMQRHHTVSAAIAAPLGLEKRKSISHRDMIRAAELDPFAAYSIACADWVAIPRVTKKEAKWQRVTKQRQVGTNTVSYQAWQVHVALTLELTAFEFVGGTWVSRGTVGTDGSKVGAAQSIAESGDAVNQMVSSMGESATAFGPISAVPDPGCKVPVLDEVKAVADGFTQCGQATLAVTESAARTLELNPETEPDDEKESDDGEESSDDDSATSNDSSAKTEPAPNGIETEPKHVSTTDKAGKPKLDTSSATDSSGKANASDKGAKPNPTSAKPTAGSRAEQGSSEVDANDASSEAGAAKEDPKPELDELGREALNVATSQDPRRAALTLAKQKLGEHVPEGLGETVEAAQALVSTCKAGVENVVKLSDTLRKIAENPLAQVKDAALGFAGCAGIPLTYNLNHATPPGTTQKASSYCKNLDDDASRGAQAMIDVAKCESRNATERTVLQLKTDAVNEWWAIEMPLAACAEQVDDDTHCIAVGKTEGIHRGDMFFAMSLAGERLGFGYITEQGGGAQDPSRFVFRAGDADRGTSMREYAKTGLLLGARPQYAYLLRESGLTSKEFYGGAIEGGYNAGRFVSVGQEFWVRANIVYLVGRDSETLLNIEALPEAQYYLFNRVAAFVQSGVALNFGSKRTPGSTASDDTMSGLAYAVMLGLGLDVALHPEWNLRFAGTGSQGFTAMKLSNKQKTASLDVGRLTWVQGTVSLAHSF